MKALIILANGFEEVEGITQIDFLRRSGVEVVTASINNEQYLTGQYGVTVEADELLTDLKEDEYDIVILPGGLKGMENMNSSSRVEEILKKFYADNKWIAAICAAPVILGRLGFLENKNCICYPGFEDKLIGGKILNEKVVVDGNIITSKGPGTSLEFAVKIIELLCGKEKAIEIAENTQFWSC